MALYLTVEEGLATLLALDKIGSTKSEVGKGTHRMLGNLPISEFAPISLSSAR